jgi:hypothetical protein
MDEPMRGKAMRGAPTFTRTAEKWWLFGNLGGIAVWTYVASAIWPWPPYEHCDFAPGDPWYFFVIVVPLLGLALVVHIAVLIASIVRGRRTHNWTMLVAVLVTASIWTGAATYDHYRGQRYVTDECPTK